MGLAGGERRSEGAGGRLVVRRGAALTLLAKPKALTHMTAESGEVATLARSVAAQIDWPGKPAPIVEVPALTPGETARFESGRQLYENLCVACHQPDGRGRERVAPSLVGSPLGLGDSGIPIRILLAGKEGSVGLMPPLNALSDEEVAAVLTYTRREWGNGAAAVGPDDVREIRGLTKARTRPWTNEELAAVPNGRAPGGPGSGRRRAGP